MTARDDGFFTHLTPAEIYRQLTQGKGAGPLEEAQQILHTEAPEEDDRATLIASLGELIATGWQGEAGAAAQGAALPLRDHVLANADKLDRAQDLLSRQIGSFERAYHSVRPVPEVPEQRLDEPVPFDVDIAKEVAFYQAVAQHNIDVFGQYDGASQYNETNMPQEFHAGGRDGGDVSVRSPDTIEVGERRSGGEPEMPGGGDGTPRSGDGSWPGGFPGAGRPGDSGAVSADSGVLPGVSGEVSGAGAQGGVTGASSVSSPGAGQAGGNDHRGGYPASGYSSPLPGGSVSGGVGGGSVGGYSGGAPRMSGGAVAGPVVRGPGGAVGAGALAAEENAARRGGAIPAARGGAGFAGAPLGAGRGRDDEDAEHERKVLIEADSEEIFGSDVLTAPSVIGDDEYED